MSARSTSTSGRPWVHRLAGGLLAVVGLVNAVLASWAFAGEALNVTTGVAAALLGAGLVTVAAGVLIWRRSRITTDVALTVFALLLLAQLSALAGGVEAADVVRLTVLAVLVLALAFAAVQQRRPRN
ncbi:MAG: hypothetical protein GEU81_17835 [Nitriliruptorales bacterium]|nr:hypothetical protein [Nitriliruptorales bacterium]